MIGRKDQHDSSRIAFCMPKQFVALVGDQSTFQQVENKYQLCPGLLCRARQAR